MGRAWPAPGEPLWTDDDSTEILDYLADEHLICPGCGHLKAETFDPVNEFAYVATPIACAACAAKDRVKTKLDVLEGVYIVAEKRLARDARGI